MPGDLALSPAELASYSDQGWVGPYGLLDRQEIRLLNAAYERERNNFIYPGGFAKDGWDQGSLNPPWFKSMHAYVPEFLKVATNPGILERVRSILGMEVVVWGTTVMERTKGQTHRWHVDIEHRYWPGVSVFLALENVDLSSSLYVFPGSHMSPQMPAEITAGIHSGDPRQAVETTIDLSSPLPIEDGQFCLFDGLLWHGSYNRSGRRRRAMLIQYTKPPHEPKIPLSFEVPARWHPANPPYLCVASDNSLNWRNAQQIR